jgi:hypothetical protein
MKICNNEEDEDAEDIQASFEELVNGLENPDDDTSTDQK